MPFSPIKPVTNAPRMYELIVNTDVPLEGVFDDWPAQVQDKIMEALQRLADHEKRRIVITSAAFAVDVDTGPYLHVIASEVVEIDPAIAALSNFKGTIQ